MITSDYTKILRLVQKLKCHLCGGLGTQDDAEPGDITYNTWTCTHCHGSGWEDGDKFKQLLGP